MKSCLNGFSIREIKQNALVQLYSGFLNHDVNLAKNKSNQSY